MADHHHTLPPEETLAVINSHLGRFMLHADELIQECRSFGESMRSSLESQLDKMNGTVARSLDEAAQRAAQSLDGKLDSALGDRLTALRQELDQLVHMAEGAAEGASATAAPVANPRPLATAVPAPAAIAPGPRRLAVPLLLLLSNLMLGALLLLSVLELGPDRTSAVTTAAVVDAGPVDEHLAADLGDAGPTGAPESALIALCSSLAEGPDTTQAYAFVAAAAADSCPRTAGAVTANVLGGLGADAVLQERAKAGAESPAKPPNKRRRGNKAGDGGSKPKKGS
ncbi:hypothetical protein [Haliangium sp.]|uniref:hypothetical protein n=1 Tax=Haliangium sp. TaxID=2663208 RepID=UPI003D1087FC